MANVHLCQALRLSALVAMAAFAAGPSMADVDRSPKPSGVYGLKPGIFVMNGTSCKSPPNAAIKLYDGKGISTAHTHACSVRILSKRRSGYGYRYTVSQSCVDAGAGPAKRFVERQTIDVPDALTFTIRSQGGTAYRYCPIYELPPGLREVANHPGKVQ